MLYAKNSPVEALTPGMIFDVYNDDGTRCDSDTRPHYIVRQTPKFGEMRGLVRKFTVNFDNTKHTMVSHSLFNDFDLWDESTDRAVGALRAIFERDAVQFDVYIRDEDKNRLKIPPRTPSDFFVVRLRRVISFGTSTPSAYGKLTIPTTSIRALQRPTVHR